MRRLTILLAAVGALLLVPAAQAFATDTAFVNIAGTGQGEVSSVGGIGAFETESEEWAAIFESFGNAYEGSPPIECSGPPATGTCETALVNDGLGTESVALHAVAAPGSEFTSWTIEEGLGNFAGCEPGATGTEEGENPTFCLQAAGEGTNLKVTANFTCEIEGGCKGGPTNRRLLTLTKSPSPSAGTGVGTVSSKPKGIKCAVTCESAVGSFYKEANVILTAKPSLTSTFVEWGAGGACEGSTSPTCEVAMSEDQSAEAVFGGTSKAILSPTALSVSKGESSGYGTVKATGLACEAECTTTTSLYQGTITEPKPKEAKTVTLSQVPAFGSEFSGWSGCDSEAEGKCIVAMSEAKEVTATYTAKPNVALTVSKNTEAGEYAGGTGTVTSKPKGIKCATTCTTQTMAVPSGEAVVLKAKAALGMTFVGWSGGGCSGAAETCTVTPSEATHVTATFSGSPKAIASETALTLAKAGSGFGTVKATGLTCEALCTSATSLYQGTVTEPKPKEAKIVVLVATSAAGSKAVVWSGCDSEPEGNCQVQMSEAKEVTATFDELE